MNVLIFTFNGFQENTYILYDDTKECVIVDPGCNSTKEQALLSEFIANNDLTPVRLLNTHCHIDHVLGNKYVADTYGLKLESHKGEIPVLESCTAVANMYGIPYEQSPPISVYLDEGDIVTFGNTKLEVIFTPGHSPASISFYNKAENILMAGDVLFQRSIGRTDLPGGSMDTLLHMIRTKYWVLPDETIVYPGHGPATTIGEEKRENPFLNQA